MSTPTISVVNLVKRFGTGPRAVEAVRGISFTAPRGKTVALLGGNGAGKTTTISMLLGVLQPTSGFIEVLGCDMATARHTALARVNLTSPYVDLPKRLTVAENLTVFARLYGVRDPRERVAQVVREFDLGALMPRPYGALSAGQRTRVSVAKALLNEPQVLLLDEPTASLDPDAADQVRTALSAYQVRTHATFLLASHNMAEVERMADTVLMMKAGEIVDRGSPDDLIARHGRADMEAVFLAISRNESISAMAGDA